MNIIKQQWFQVFIIGFCTMRFIGWIDGHDIFERNASAATWFAISLIIGVMLSAFHSLFTVGNPEDANRHLDEIVELNYKITKHEKLSRAQADAIIDRDKLIDKLNKEIDNINGKGTL